MKKYIVSLLTGILAIAATQQSKAQSYSLRYMYDQYMYMINPAALKIGEGLGLNAGFSSNQFKEIYDNRLFSLGAEGGIFNDGKMAVGLTLFQENEGIFQNSNVQLQYAYRVKLTDEHWLTFGVSAGLLYEGQNTDRIITGDYSDPLIGENQTAFSGGLGINYKWDNLNIDLAVPYYNTINEKYMPFFAGASYRFKIDEIWSVKPIVMYSNLNAKMNLGDFRVQGTYKDFLWLQAGCRTSKELLFAAGGEYMNFKLGIAYGFNFGNYGDLNKGNVEVVLAYRFKDVRVHKSTSSTEQSLSQISSDLADLKRSDEKQTQELQNINTTIQKMNTDLNNEFKGSLKQIEESVQNIQRSDLEQVDEAKILDKGYFVVVYSTTSMDDAQAIIYRMKKQNVAGSVVKDAKRNYFYIYTEVFSDLNTALAQADKEREKGFSGAWVLVVK